MNKRQCYKYINKLIEEKLVDGWAKAWLITPYQKKMIRRHRKRLSKIIGQSPILGKEKK